MKYSSSVNVNAEENRKAIEKWLSSFEEEHQGYYGKPCGFKSANGSLLKELFKLEDGLTFHLGYNRVEIAGTEFRFWLRSSGTVVGVATKGQEVTLFANGRRQSLIEVISKEIYLTTDRASALYETTEPGWEPWETSVNHMEQFHWCSLCGQVAVEKKGGATAKWYLCKWCEGSEAAIERGYHH